MTGLFAVECLCGRQVRSAVSPAAVRCDCGRLCEIDWRALDVASKPEPVTVSWQEGLK